MPLEPTLQSILEAQAEQQPSGVAVYDDSKTLSYGEINLRAERLARYLGSLDIGPEAVVAIHAPRSIESVVAICGVLKAGAAYLPLDPSQPSTRIDQILAFAKPAVVLSGMESPVTLRDLPGTHVCGIGTAWESTKEADASYPTRHASPENPLYVLYTSGSTGTPKGVCGLHRSVLDRLRWLWEAYPFEAGEVACHKTALTFVDSVAELFGPLLQGIPSVVLDSDTVLNIRRFADAIVSNRVTRLITVPSVLRELLRTAPQPLAKSRLKLVMSSGETLTADLSESFYRTLPNARLVNLYGSTEVADATVLEVSRRAPRSVSIGNPIPHTGIYILDQQLNPVAGEDRGEIYIGGESVARGYWHQPELTAEKFIPNPFGASGARMYRTGDFGRRRADGEIEFHGRMDGQIQLRGNRIELGEVEAAIESHPAVTRAVARVWGHASAERLVAYVTLCPNLNAKGDVPLSGAKLGVELRNYLRRTLPGYMLPSTFVELTEIPRTPSGKVDRQALPAPETKQDYSAEPVTPTEMLVERQWAEALELEKVSIDDDFFQMGGHSLLATRLLLKLSEALNVELIPRQLYDHPTVRSLSAAIDSAVADQGGLLRIPHQSRHGSLPLSINQEDRLLFELQNELNGIAHAQLAGQLGIVIDGALNVDLLEDAINAVIQRHEVLRCGYVPIVSIDGRETVLQWGDGKFDGPSVRAKSAAQVRQTIRSRARVDLTRVDLSGMTSAEQETQARLAIARDSEQPFDYARPPFVRPAVFRLHATQHLFSLVLSHVIHDGWSSEIWLAELAECYAAFSANRQPSLPDLPAQYGDFAAWQRHRLEGDHLRKLEAYWKRQREDFPHFDPKELPFAKALTALPSIAAEKEMVVLSAELSQDIRSFAQQIGVSSYVYLLTIFAALLYAIAGRGQFSLWAVLANRQHPDVQNLIGWFTNVHAFGINLTGNPTLHDLAIRVRTAISELLSNGELPQPLLADLLDHGQNPRAVRCMPSTITFQMPPLVRPLEKAGLTFTQTFLSHDQSGGLRVLVVDSSSVFRITALFPPDLFDPTDIATFLGSYESLIRSALASPRGNLGDLARQAEIPLALEQF